MAGAKPAVHMVQLKPIAVHEALIAGQKFIKWDDNSTTGTPVTMKVESHGYILYWKDQVQDMDCIEILHIRDTRTGKYAKLPKDQKLQESLEFGSTNQNFENKCITIVYGMDMVNVEMVNFACSSSEIATLWCDELLSYAKNVLAINWSPLTILEKEYSKLKLVLSSEGRIPTKNFMKLVTSSKDDRKRVEKALDASKLPFAKESARTGSTFGIQVLQVHQNDMINPNKFSFEDFLFFYRNLLSRTEVDKVFDSLGAKKKPYLTTEQFMNFLNTEQRDPRLNEVLYPQYTRHQCEQLIAQFETKSAFLTKGHLSQEGFLRYLLSEENNLVPVDKLDLSHDMSQPICHYFINSSHNTYLTGHQLTGKSSVEMYRQCLLSGCRCIELDCWEGKGTDEEPIITHGFTMCTDILFKEVIEAIKESAFKTSDYPVILSFENHCSTKQQAKMAEYCRTIFGDQLVTEPLEDFPLKAGSKLPSPEDFLRKFIVKNKKKHFHQRRKTLKSSIRGRITQPSTEHEPTQPTVIERPEKEEESDSDSAGEDEDDIRGLTEEEEKKRQREKREKEKVESASDSDSDEDPTEGTAGSEAEAGLEMSELVNYVTPVQFHSFEYAEKRNRSYEISSFVETQATTLLKEFPVEFVNYNKRQLSRIYPRGTRVDSGNFMPQVFWNAGCQLVALNFQSLDLAMQLNLGIFEYNNSCGYILKPGFMRRRDRTFDPFAESTVDGIIAGNVCIKVISGQFLTDKKIGTYVEVDMYGLPTDTVRKRFKTKTISGNGINPVYDEEPFQFKKVVLPALASIRLAVYEETGRMIGHRILPVEGLRPGYRHVVLRNECNVPLPLASLFVHIQVKDYVPDAFADFAAALSNPIAYALEKHTEQLAVLTEDFDVDEDLFDAFEQAELDGHHSTQPSIKRSLQSSMKKRDDSVSSVPEGSSKDTGSANTHASLSKTESSSSAYSVSSNNSGGGGGGGSANQSTTAQITRMLSAAVIENGLVRSNTNNQSKLNNPALVIPCELEKLKLNKVCQKAYQKRDKDTDTLKKKNLKDYQLKKEAHEAALERIFVTQLKARTALEKQQTKVMKKEGKDADEINQQMNELLTEQDNELKAFKEGQKQEMLDLGQSHYKAEFDAATNSVLTIAECLKTVVEADHFLLRKKLQDIHDHEVSEMKKRLDAQNRDDRKSLAKKHKDKEELSRMKRETQQKHVNQVVAEIQRMQDLLKKRQLELEKNISGVWKKYDAEIRAMKKFHKEEYETRCRELTTSLDEVPTEESNGHG